MDAASQPAAAPTPSRLDELLEPNNDRPLAKLVEPVLIVDDQAAMRTILTRLLASLGVSNVVAVGTAREAFDLLHDLRFKVMLCDVEMDEIDGLQLVSAVRSDKTIPSIAILLVTASMSQRHVGRARAVRADGYLIKPFTAESLRRKLVEIVAIRPPEVEADDPSAPKGHNAKVTRWSKSQDDSD